MQPKYILAADIELTSPLHIGDVVKGTYDPSTNRIHRYSKGPGVGCALTRTLKLAPHSAMSANDDRDDGNEDGEVATLRPVHLTVPIITGTKVRSAMRRSCAGMIFDSWIGRDIQVSPDVVNAMTSGAHTTRPDAGVRTPQVDVFCDREPFWGLFGGSSMFLEGISQVSNGLPLIDQVLHMLATPALADPTPGVRDLSDMVQALPILRTDSVASSSVPRLSDLTGMDELIKEHAKRMAQRAEVAKRKEKAANGEEADSGKKTELKALNAIEVVRAGMRFGLRVQLRSPTPAHLGLALLALQDLLRVGQIGGGGARSLGNFLCTPGHNRLYKVDPATGKIESAVGMFGGREAGYAFAADTTIEEAVAAARDYIDEVSADVRRAIVYADTNAIDALYAGKRTGTA